MLKLRVIVVIFALLCLGVSHVVIFAQDSEDDGGIAVPTDEIAPDTTIESEYVWSVEWSPDGTKIAFGIGPAECNHINNDYSVHIVDSINQQLIIRVDTYNQCPDTHIEWSPDGSMILTSSSSGILVSQVETGEPLSAIYPPGGSANPFVDSDWSPDGSRIASIVLDGTSVNVWNPLTGNTIASYLSDQPNAISWSPDGTKLAIVDSQLSIRDTLTGQIITTFPPQGGRIAWSPDGTKLAGINGYNQIEIVDSNTGDALQTLSGHTGYVTDMKWRSDSAAIASSSEDGTVRVWDVETGNQIGLLTNSVPIRAVDWSPDGSQLAYGGEMGNTIQITPASEIISATSTVP